MILKYIHSPNPLLWGILGGIDGGKTLKVGFYITPKLHRYIKTLKLHRFITPKLHRYIKTLKLHRFITFIFFLLL